MALSCAVSLGAVIDVMLVFDTYAQDYAKKRHGGSLEAYATSIIEEANLFYANSGVNIELNCVKAVAWDYTSTGDGEADLNNITNSAEIRSLRSSCKADMVSFITTTSSWGNLGGIAWLGRAQNAGIDIMYSAVNRTTGAASSFVHELGHNMGLTHSPDQSTQPGGDGLYPYSCGYHFTGAKGKKYHTIMAYNFDGHGNTYSPTSMFSNPDKIFDGVPMGTVEKHNSTLSLNQRRLYMARLNSEMSAAPRIIEDPQNAKITDLASSASFTVEAEREFGASYKWQKKPSKNGEWADMPSKTSKTLSFTGAEVLANFSSYFRCAVSNTYGTSYSAEAAFDFEVPPITLISSSSETVDVYEGGDAELFVEVQEADVSFQWQKKSGSNYSNIAGAASPGLLLQNQTAGASYRCKITRGDFVFYAPTSTVAIRKRAKITADLSGEISAYTNNPATLSIKASGYQLEYQWQVLQGDEFIDIEGATEAKFTIESADFSDEAVYRCVVSNGGATAVSNEARLSVLKSATIDSEMPDCVVYSGENAIFEAPASGHNLSYTWQESKNGSSWNTISGAAESVLVLENVKIQKDGYFYRCLVSNGGGRAFSNAAQLTVNARAEIEKSPRYYCAGFERLSVGASGFDLHYKWQKKQGGIWVDAGSDSSELAITQSDWESQTVFKCTVGNTLNFDNAFCTPEILPVDTTLVVEPFAPLVECAEGSKIVLEADISDLSGGKTACLWYVDKNDGKGFKPAAKKPALSLSPKLNMSGWKYRFEASNGADFAGFETELLVREKLKITAKPKAASVFEGADSPTFSASASGYNPQYRWQRQVSSIGENGKTVLVWEDIDGASENSYSPETSSELNGTSFRLKIYNGVSEIYTSAAKYTVFAAAKISGIKVSQNKSEIDPEEAAEYADITLEAQAEGYSLKYKWFENGAEIKGATKKTLAIKKPFAGESTYTCQVYNLDKKEIATSALASVEICVNPQAVPGELTGQSLSFFNKGECEFTLAFTAPNSAKVLDENAIFVDGGTRSYALYKPASASYKPRGGAADLKLALTYQDALETADKLILSKAQKIELSGEISFDENFESAFGDYEVVRNFAAENALPSSLANRKLALGEVEIIVSSDGKTIEVSAGGAAAQKGALTYKKVSPCVATFSGKYGSRTIKDGALAVSENGVIYSYQDAQSRLFTGIAKIE